MLIPGRPKASSGGESIEVLRDGVCQIKTQLSPRKRTSSGRNGRNRTVGLADASVWLGGESPLVRERFGFELRLAQLRGSQISARPQAPIAQLCQVTAPHKNQSQGIVKPIVIGMESKQPIFFIDSLYRSSATNRIPRFQFTASKTLTAPNHKPLRGLDAPRPANF